jgi:capsule polysaccharide export protein KpsE/RkpR
MCDNWTFDYFRRKLETIEHMLIDIKTKETLIMTQLEELNAAIAAEDVEVQDLLTSVSKIGTDIDALLAKIAAGGTTTDLAAQLQAIQSHVASLTTAAQQLKDSDTKANA